MMNPGSRDEDGRLVRNWRHSHSAAVSGSRREFRRESMAREASGGFLHHLQRQGVYRGGCFRELAFECF